MDERIWLRHNETGGFFHAPAEVADTFGAMGWEPSGEPPAEPNPVIAERVAFEHEHQAKAAQEAKAKPRARKAEPKAEEQEETTETPRRGTTEKEG